LRRGHCREIRGDCQGLDESNSIQAVIPHFKTRNAGHLINVSGALSRTPFAPPHAAYSSAKAGLNILTASLRMELRATHPAIQISTILYPVVATEFGINAVGGGMDSRSFPGAQRVEDAAAALMDLIEHPRPEAWGTPETGAMALRYAQDPAAVEAEIAARFRR
jgi:NAD(P)-dependent dehydrogenase (short-subunit alcohol dehydrogenase family)